MQITWIKGKHRITPTIKGVSVKGTSRILCKWQQDFGCKFTPYILDSVFERKHKLVHNQATVVNWLCPFLLNFHQG